MNFAFVDWARSAPLCRAGAPGWAAAVCIGANGRQDLVLIDGTLLGDESCTNDPDCRGASHEQPGPLPHRVQHRVWAVPAHRCGRRTQSGAPCRTPVANPGDPCAWHGSPPSEVDQ